MEINIIADEKTAKKRVEIVRKAFADVIITAEIKHRREVTKKTTVSIIHFKKGYGTLKLKI